MEGLKLIPAIALMITIAGVIIGASVIAMGKFGDTMTQCYNGSYTYNTTVGGCVGVDTNNLPSVGKKNMTEEYFSVVQGIDGENTVAEQLPTVAIIAVMVIIISVIAGVFVYMRYLA